MTTKTKTKRRDIRRVKRLSTLLRIAVEDAKAVARMKGYKLNMSVWHQPDSYGICHVCMAGAVVARSLGFAKVYVAPLDEEDIDREVSDRMLAINYMRNGNFYGAFSQLGGCYEDNDKKDLAMIKARSLVMENYREWDGRAPWDVYEKAAKILERAGL